MLSVDKQSYRDYLPKDYVSRKASWLRALANTINMGSIASLVKVCISYLHAN